MMLRWEEGGLLERCEIGRALEEEAGREAGARIPAIVPGRGVMPRKSGARTPSRMVGPV